jgi:hypothetical protein
LFTFGGERPREQDAVGGARLTIEIGADFGFFRTFDDQGPPGARTSVLRLHAGNARRNNRASWPVSSNGTENRRKPQHLAVPVSVKRICQGFLTLDRLCFQAVSPRFGSRPYSGYRSCG